MRTICCAYQGGRPFAYRWVRLRGSGPYPLPLLPTQAPLLSPLKLTGAGVHQPRLGSFARAKFPSTKCVWATYLPPGLEFRGLFHAISSVIMGSGLNFRATTFLPRLS